MYSIGRLIYYLCVRCVYSRGMYVEKNGLEDVLLKSLTLPRSLFSFISFIIFCTPFEYLSNKEKRREYVRYSFGEEVWFSGERRTVIQIKMNRAYTSAQMYKEVQKLRSCFTFRR